jgi:hypothetical protein
MTIQGSWGLLLLAIWLIISGICVVLSVGNPVLHVLLGILAIVAGVLIFIGR